MLNAEMLSRVWNFQTASNLVQPASKPVTLLAFTTELRRCMSLTLQESSMMHHRPSVVFLLSITDAYKPVSHKRGTRNPDSEGMKITVSGTRKLIARMHALCLLKEKQSSKLVNESNSDYYTLCVFKYLMRGMMAQCVHYIGFDSSPELNCVTAAGKWFTSHHNTLWLHRLKGVDAGWLRR